MTDPEQRDYRLVVTYNVKGTDEADVVRRFSSERTHVDGWLTLVERIEVDEQT